MYRNDTSRFYLIPDGATGDAVSGPGHDLGRIQRSEVPAAL